jgi:hypothetical protein
MAEQPIQIEVTFDGASEATRELGRVSQGISNVGQTADRAGVTVESFSRGFQNTAQRIQGVAGAVQTLASTFGSENRTGSLVASVAGATAQFASMGAMLGPTGAVVGGIAGLAAGLFNVVTASDSSRSAIEQLRETMQNATTDADRYAAALALVRGEDEAAARSERARAIRGENWAALNLPNEELRAEIRAREAEINQLIDQYGAAAESGTRVSALREDIRRLEILSSVESETTIFGEPAAASAPARRGGGGGGRRGRDVFEMLGGAASNEDIAGISAEFERLAAERAEREAEANALIEEKRNAHYEALKEMAIEAQDAELERQREVNEALAEMERERQERIREGQLAEKENQEAEEERSLERRRSLNGELMGLLGDATMAFGKSLAAIATGEQTAEEAFQGLAKAFLEMISQYATMKAATEFADAAASFAKYDYAGGAAHIGAGVAFTAIAVATGVGAAAIGSAPSAPARPEAGGGTEAAQGGDVVINWNSPVITAGTQAELGRELQAAVSAAGSI